jgi:hypothetical protein
MSDDELAAFLHERLQGAPLTLALSAHEPALHIELSSTVIGSEGYTRAALDRVAALADEVLERCFERTDEVWAVAQHVPRVRQHLPADAVEPDRVDLTAATHVEVEGLAVPPDQWALLQHLLGVDEIAPGSARTGVNLYGTTSEQLGLPAAAAGTDDLPYVEVRVPVELDRLRHLELFGHIVRQDFPGTGPSLAWDVYLVNLSRRLILSVYDDRGMHLLGDVDVLRTLEAAFAHLDIEGRGTDVGTPRQRDVAPPG